MLYDVRLHGLLKVVKQYIKISLEGLQAVMGDRVPCVFHTAGIPMLGHSWLRTYNKRDFLESLVKVVYVRAYAQNCCSDLELKTWGEQLECGFDDHISAEGVLEGEKT